MSSMVNSGMWTESTAGRGKIRQISVIVVLAALVTLGCGLVSQTPEVPHSSDSQPAIDPALSLTNTPFSIEVSSVNTSPDPAGYKWMPIANGFDNPVDLASAGDGLLFVVEQPGTIRILRNHELQPEFALDIRDRVGNDANEQGLLGLAVHPDFSENGWIFVNYTDKLGDTVIARFQLPPGTKAADPDSEFRLLEIRQPFGNHNGGGLAFGPDGYLYIALGDGGAAGDPRGNGQDLDSLLGKILRIDVDRAEPYSIPSDNPFATDANSRPEIWAYGMRNPWRLSFDSLTGNLYIGDVGQNQWEEIDFYPAGAPGGFNFGWNYREGAHEFEGKPPESVELVEPVAEYGRGGGCSVTGGYVYRGSALPEWDGMYFFGDFCSGTVWGLLMDSQGVWQKQQLFELDINISSFGIDALGEVYVVDIGGQILKLVSR